jgi:hypothetical protein
MDFAEDHGEWSVVTNYKDLAWTRGMGIPGSCSWDMPWSRVYLQYKVVAH